MQYIVNYIKLQNAKITVSGVEKDSLFIKPGARRRRPARSWFLKIDPVRIVGMRVCVCVSTPEATNN